MLYIHGATILTPDQRLESGALLADGPHIVQLGSAEEVMPPSAAHVIDATGLLLVPGFIDLQINGGFGHDFTADPTSIWTVAAGLPRYGVTAFMPTIVTSPLETIATAQQVLAGERPEAGTELRLSDCMWKARSSIPTKKALTIRPICACPT
jgi:N-acetylglucosamine-6-phosphate deacetylase